MRQFSCTHLPRVWLIQPWEEAECRRELKVRLFSIYLSLSHTTSLPFPALDDSPEAAQPHFNARKMGRSRRINWSPANSPPILVSVPIDESDKEPKRRADTLLRFINGIIVTTRYNFSDRLHVYTLRDSVFDPSPFFSISVRSSIKDVRKSEPILARWISPTRQTLRAESSGGPRPESFRDPGDRWPSLSRQSFAFSAPQVPFPVRVSPPHFRAFTQIVIFQLVNVAKCSSRDQSCQYIIYAKQRTRRKRRIARHAAT